SATRPIRLSLRPIRVSRCVWWRRIGLPICSTTMVLPVFGALLMIYPAASPSLGRGLLGVAVATACLQGGNLDAAASGHRAWAVLMLEGIKGGTHHVVGVRRSDRLCDHVLHSERLKHSSHRAARNDARAGRGCAQIDLARPVAAEDVVMQGAALAQRHADEVTLGCISGLADRFGNLPCLAVTKSD